MHDYKTVLLLAHHSSRLSVHAIDRYLQCLYTLEITNVPGKFLAIKLKFTARGEERVT